VSCAAALTTIDLIEKELASNAAQVGSRLLGGLQDLMGRQKLITDLRGLGLMIGVEFSNSEVADAVEAACFKRGVLVLRAGDSAIRFAPPLVITEEQAATGVRVFEEACAEVAASA
jgi:4-aminobutyrate aminotransferase